MIKVQFGSGENKLEGWQNLQEQDADITKPLKFDDSSVDYILAEHVVEHVTPKQAWSFFCECYRVLKPNGVARILVPDVSKIYEEFNSDYSEFIRQGAPRWYKEAGLIWKDKPVTVKEAVQTIIFCHGHQACWDTELLQCILASIGFYIDLPDYGESKHEALRGVDGLWKMMGLERCKMESAVVEATKK
jgi:SAM-dependent methyltransferase